MEWMNLPKEPAIVARQVVWVKMRSHPWWPAQVCLSGYRRLVVSGGVVVVVVASGDGDCPEMVYGVVCMVNVSPLCASPGVVRGCVGAIVVDE